MRLLPWLSRHLHSQIVVPLVLALMCVGVVATLVAVSLIGMIITGWIDENAGSTSTSAIHVLREQGDDLLRGANLAAQSMHLGEPSLPSDTGELTAQLVRANSSLQEDNLMLLDESGVLMGSTGRLQLRPGTKPIAGKAFTAISLAMASPVFAEVDGIDALCGVATVTGPEGQTYLLVLSTVVDDAYLATLAEGSHASLALYDAERNHVACYVPAGLGGETLTAMFEGHSPEISQVLDHAEGGRSRTEAIEVAGAEYRVIAEKVSFSDPDDSVGNMYLTTTVGTAVTDRTRVTTTTLITMWSILAVVALMGLGYYVARSVSTPLELLSSSAAQVAEGDFGAKVEITGSNEVSDLARNFNRMTDSLRERSESLTKKVLELATLYEMSRSLGSTLELETLLDSVLDSALRIFDVEIGYITMIDQESGKLEVLAWKGTDLSRAADATVRNSMSEWVIREGRPLIFNPQTEQEGLQGDGMSGALAALCVPLTSSEGTIGSITVGSRNPDQRFSSDDVRLLATIANHVTIAVGNIGLFSSVQEAYLATVRALAAAVDAKDPYTRGHSDGVAAYALRIGEAMHFSAEQMVALEMAAYLHDIGKIGISEDILLKPGKLTDAEMSQMRHHPLIGANILKPVAFPWPIAPIVRHHHEHFNGEGYPAGLKTEEIPILARVLTVADAFEAMVADRPYRRGRSQQEAILELRRCSGAQFDPRVIDAFIQVLESDDFAMEVDSHDEEDVGPDEAQAVYIAVADAMFASFRRLGGPRLANNLERTVNDALRVEDIMLLIQAGHLVSRDGESSDEELSAHLSRALVLMGEGIEAASGAGLADHFMNEALDTLPERMRAHAQRLGLAPRT